MTMFEPDTSGKKIGPFWFAPGISALNASTVAYGAFSTLSILTYMNFIQPYVLNEILQIPDERQGTLTGFLGTIQEIVVILLMGWIGAASDNVGRRIIYVVGFLFVAVGFFIYPLATSELQLILFRVIFAIGAAITPVMLSACIIDAIQERTRGKWVGFTSVFNGLGIVFMALVLAQLPKLYGNMGFNGAEAGRYAFWTASVFATFSALIIHLGLKAGRPAAIKERQKLIKHLGRGFKAGLSNPKIALAYASAFVGRGDLVIIGTFFSLWFVRYGEDIGLSPGQTMSSAGIKFAILQISAICWAYLFGMIVDRINRVTSVILAFGAAAITYGALGLLQNPLGIAIIPVIILLGMSETSCVISAAALIGQEAPAKIRGAIIGVFNLLGGVGIAVALTAGGFVFDNWLYTGPFLMMAGLNTLIFLVALVVRQRAGEPTVHEPEAAASD